MKLRFPKLGTSQNIAYAAVLLTTLAVTVALFVLTLSFHVTLVRSLLGGDQDPQAAPSVGPDPADLELVVKKLAPQD